MLFKSVAAAAAFAVASQAASDVAVPVRMSVRELFGAVHPRDDAGYLPGQTFCAMGTSCSEACGAGFEMCPSNDNSIHCFNQGAKAQCCPGNAGVSCEDGFYCANDAAGEQLCCPVGKSLAECEGAVVSVAALPPVTSTATTSSSSSSTSSSSSSSVSSLSIAANTTTSAVSSSSTLSANTTASAGFTTRLNSTTAATTGSATRTPISFTSSSVAVTSTPTSAPSNGAGVVGPSAFLLGLAAVAFTALL
ncbi:hypothetical protein GGTG_08534 [Gaeumannomyces tritici R3-111a-1]|uniref:Prp 4 CRoW domain-containing protein n=1 Tax=Gaeumannomyces tritici (strain R3-111a-1) TaxID=644352 RepID=J3P4U8_GAET3|nr:hypothetical protein GGTG_08534 [Gaeumannomyces tritici R3-111a-1]EJT74696.1 hypothetical protein GGTG_08534 [Gaeumannomyces tritici R3-111a-1]